MTQLTFDLDQLITTAALEAAPAWQGAPLRYHEELHTSVELDAAFARYVLEKGHFGCIPNSHMWKRDGHTNYLLKNGNAEDCILAINGHTLNFFQADARCDYSYGQKDHQHSPGELPNTYMFQSICDSCNWHKVSHSENEVIEAWHDHALPGWRNLPHVPLRLRNASSPNGLHTWVEANYPDEWQQPGYPILTERTQMATRHISGGSPWNGYDFGISID